MTQGLGSSVLKNALRCFSEEGVYRALVSREVQVQTGMSHDHLPTSTAERPRGARYGPPGAPSHNSGGGAYWRSSFRKSFLGPSKAGLTVVCAQQFSERRIPKETHTRGRRKTG